MRTFAAVIKILIFLMVMSIGITAILLGLKITACASVVAMLLLFLCQAAEIFLGYKQ